MSEREERYRQQSEYNRRVYDLLREGRPDLADRKVTVSFYSALHRVNYSLATRTGRVPPNRADRNKRVRRELPRIFDRCRGPCAMGRRARY